MSDLASRIRGLRIEGTSADANIKVALTANGKLDVGFRPQMYKKYEEPVLASQLADVLGRALRSSQDAMDAIVESENGRPPDRKRVEADAERRRYLEQRARIVARGISDGRWMRLSLANAREWTVEIKPRAVDTLSENEFIAELKSGVRNVRSDYSRQNFQAKKENGRNLYTGGI